MGWLSSPSGSAPELRTRIVKVRSQQRCNERHQPRDGLESRPERPKPAWVRHEALRLKALTPENGCRKVGETFGDIYQACDELPTPGGAARPVPGIMSTSR